MEELLILTEQCEKRQKTEFGPHFPPPFVSLVTLKALRITMKSMKDIAASLFASGFKYILTGKINQDCLEVLFKN